MIDKIKIRNESFDKMTNEKEILDENLQDENQYIDLMNDTIKDIFKTALRITIKNPSQAGFFVKTIARQRNAAKIREKWQDEGVRVPPLMIFSVTNQCNLQCPGCYAMAHERPMDEEMSPEKIKNVFEEANELGISFVLLAGGEPLVKPEILEISKDFPQIIFPLFTNGLLIDDDITQKLKKYKNIVPIISMEGYQEDTDGRRGKGVYEHLQRTISNINNNGIFSGISLTMTRSNFATVTKEEFVQSLIDLGCKIFFFVEYNPVKEGTEDWILTDQQRVTVPDLMDSLRREFPGVFLAFPGDEEEFGGCLSAGRGFIHVSPEGNLEPCPFAPYSDTNLRDMTLKEALKSDFMKKIRENHQELTETNGGCALWEKREWVQSLLH
jgi:MoaA/NifB/PqqE/SkfB family radical SAM enzyme